MIRYALPLLLAFAAVPALADNSDMDIDKVNGSIRVPDNATAGKLSTVNGGIHIGAGAHVKTAETVNGGVDVDRDSTLTSIETVNGGVQVGEKVKVEKTVETVNGGITLQPGADVAGKVSNVNGGMRINGAHVGGGLETTRATSTSARTRASRADCSSMKITAGSTPTARASRASRSVRTRRCKAISRSSAKSICT